MKVHSSVYHRSAAFRETLHERDGHRCQECGCVVGQTCDKHYAVVRRLDVAHIIPWKISHDSSPGNLRLLCHPCNLREAVHPAPVPSLLDCAMALQSFREDVAAWQARDLS